MVHITFNQRPNDPKKDVVCSVRIKNRGITRKTLLGSVNEWIKYLNREDK